MWVFEGGFARAGGQGVGFWGWWVVGAGVVVSAFVVGVDAGVLLHALARVQCWLNFFITISHCPWRDFISLSNGDKETKQRKRLSTTCIKCPQRADPCFWFPRSTVLARTTDT